MYILKQDATEPLEEEAEKYVTGEIKPDSDSKADKVKAAAKEVKDAAAALSGASDIIAEMISDNADYRTYIRKVTVEEGSLTSKAKDKETRSVYENYYEYEELIKKVAGHRILALNRGESEKILTVTVKAPC